MKTVSKENGATVSSVVRENEPGWKNNQNSRKGYTSHEYDKDGLYLQD